MCIKQYYIKITFTWIVLEMQTDYNVMYNRN